VKTEDERPSIGLAERFLRRRLAEVALRGELLCFDLGTQRATTSVGVPFSRADRYFAKRQ
jgi:hypothetical protein